MTLLTHGYICTNVSRQGIYARGNLRVKANARPRIRKTPALMSPIDRIYLLYTALSEIAVEVAIGVLLGGDMDAVDRGSTSRCSSLFVSSFLCRAASFSSSLTAVKSPLSLPVAHFGIVMSVREDEVGCMWPSLSISYISSARPATRSAIVRRQIEATGQTV